MPRECRWGHVVSYCQVLLAHMTHGRRARLEEAA